MKTAVILAGGKGTRLAEIRSDVPKPMMPVLDRPLLAYQIELLKEHGFTKVWLIVNHLYEHIETYFANGEDFGIEINYYIEQQPLGTVGGVKAIEQHLQDPFLVLYGDVMMNMDLNRLITFHKNKNADATLVVHPNDHPYDSDLLAVDYRDFMDATDPSLYVYNFAGDEVINAQGEIDFDVLYHSYRHSDYLRSKAIEVGQEFSGIFQESPDAFVIRTLD